MTDELRRELPQLNEFSTLSPIPGFSGWLKSSLESDPDSVFSSAARSDIASVTDRSIEDLLETVDWLKDAAIADKMQSLLKPLAANYIVKQKKDDSRALDAVTHFHLSNGALVERINWLGDTSERGISQSYTMMVNYLYDLKRIEENHEQYIENGTIVQSKGVESLIEG